MKKILSLLVALSMVTAMTVIFSSCDIAKQYLPFLDTKNEAGNGESTNNGGNAEVKTTITKTEWLKMMNGANFTFDMNLVNVDAEGVEQSAIRSKGKTNETSQYSHSFMGTNETTTYYSKIGNVLYSIKKAGDIFVASETEDRISTKFGDLFNFGNEPEKMEESFDNFVYDENTKSYKGTLPFNFLNTVDMQVEISFENGKATNFYAVYEVIKEEKIVGKLILKASDFGTTTITLPEYWIKMSFEDFSGAFMIDNYTERQSVTYSENITANSTLKYTSTSSYSHNIMTSGDSVIMNTEEYITKIGDVTYKINNVDGRFVASESDTEFAPTDIAFGDGVDQGLYENLVYNKQTDLYTSEYTYPSTGLTYKLEAKIKDGKVTECTVSAAGQNGMSATIEYSDIGTTVIEIPEFTVAE